MLGFKNRYDALFICFSSCLLLMHIRKVLIQNWIITVYFFTNSASILGTIMPRFYRFDGTFVWLLVHLEILLGNLVHPDNIIVFLLISHEINSMLLLHVTIDRMPIADYLCVAHEAGMI